MTMKLSYLYLESPVGRLKLVANHHALVAVLWENENPNRVKMAELSEDLQHPILQETVKQLNEYFQGKRQIFDLPLDFEGTEFQHKVWQALLTIPFGETRSYKQIAEQLSISEKTVERHINEALKFLKKNIMFYLIFIF